MPNFFENQLFFYLFPWKNIKIVDNSKQIIVKSWFYMKIDIFINIFDFQESLLTNYIYSKMLERISIYFIQSHGE